MRFKLVKTGKSYRAEQGTTRAGKAEMVAEVKEEASIEPIIWETGNVDQIRSLLVVREAELVAATAQLTGGPSQDWYARNVILDLEKKIADLGK